MKDRAMTRRQCEFCHKSCYLDQLVLLEITDGTDSFDLFREVLCEPCIDRVREYWWHIAPEAHRYYRSA
jgi:hypothetical protein